MGVVIASHTSAGIHYDDGLTLLMVVIVLSVLNVFLKPLLLLFTIPFIVLTLGLGLWVINAMLLLLAGFLVEGFVVVSLPAALWGALVMSLTSLFGNLILGGKRAVRVKRSSRKASPLRSDDDVIDI